MRPYLAQAIANCIAALNYPQSLENQYLMKGMFFFCFSICGKKAVTEKGRAEQSPCFVVEERKRVYGISSEEFQGKKERARFAEEAGTFLSEKSR